MENLTQHWQNYRSLVKGKISLFSVNLEIAQYFSEDAPNICVQFTLAFSGTEEGLPQASHFQTLFNELLKIIIQLNANEQSLYAGYVIGDHKITLYCYTKQPHLLIESVAQFEEINAVNQQFDPNWDIYFDYLLPSRLEAKMSATEEILELLTQQGEDLSVPHSIKHTFYFKSKEELEHFIEQYATKLDFEIAYSDLPINLSEEENGSDLVFITTLTHEICLDNNQIYQSVEQLEQLASQLDADYDGWECQSFTAAPLSLH